ncbi:MAG: C39 family peptidase [Nocardioidaceae bacterium]
MPRRRTVAIATLALLVAAAPFVPRSHGPDGTIAPSEGRQKTPATPGRSALGAVTPAMQAEIDRVVRQGLAQPSLRGKAGPDLLAAQQVRCADFEGLTYCLGVGWTEESQATAEAEVAKAARTSAARSAAKTAVESTGDLDPLAALDATAKLSPQARAREERAELTEAARSVAKVWVLRHEIEGVPYPAGFLARHPEARPLMRTASTTQHAAAKPSSSASPTKGASPTKTATPTKGATATATASGTTRQSLPTYDDYPGTDKVLNKAQVAEQSKSWWCGPTSTQMIVWGWTDKRVRQSTWAHRLGTTSSGTDIGSITRVINKYTGWDRKDYAGPYITLDIKKYHYKKWYTLIMRHIHDYRAPVVMHPILLKRYFSYLDDDASGHYQVGRGYAKRGDKPDLVGYFEPWNQQRFDPSEPFIQRVQWHLAYQSFRANKAHPYHNIGV